MIDASRAMGQQVITSVVSQNFKEMLRRDPECAHCDLIEYGKSWVYKWLKKNGYSFRKPTSDQKLPKQLNVLKRKFLARIALKVQKHNIPRDLILNMDETGVELTPTIDRTIQSKEIKNVKVKGTDDMRQITVSVLIDYNGRLCDRLQVIWQGKTKKVQATIEPPEGWFYDQTKSHRQTTETSLRFIENVLVPWRREVIARNHLPVDQHALLIWDVYASHRSDPVIKELEANNIDVVFIDARCTSVFQPLDVFINGPFKQKLKNLECIEEGKSMVDGTILDEEEKDGTSDEKPTLKRRKKKRQLEREKNNWTILISL